MEHADDRGFYRIIGAAPHASDDAVRRLYKKRRCELAARSGHLGTDLQTRALEEAWQVLSDPEARAAYDRLALYRATGGDAGPEAAGEALACSRCRQVTAQPRYLAFTQVVSGLTRVARSRLHGIYCPRCGRDVAVGASLLTWALGWWGFPDGPVAAARAILGNVRGGEFHREDNARLLTWQALAFARSGRREVARAVAHQAVTMDPGGPHVAALQPLLAGEEGVPLLRNQWGVMRSAAVAQLFPLVFVLMGLIYLIIGLRHGR
ncbi:MAG: J domain-containing protein [Nitrospirota bacterium]|nr:J domain-containing protein [Nitrospirota bacterium]